MGTSLNCFAALLCDLARGPTLAAVQEVGQLAANASLTLAQFALVWVLRQPNVTSAIVGASRPEQINDNAIASGAHVDPSLLTEAERLLPRH